MGTLSVERRVNDQNRRPSKANNERTQQRKNTGASGGKSERFVAKQMCRNTNNWANCPVI
jgi:hypothetical protein